MKSSKIHKEDENAKKKEKKTKKVSLTVDVPLFPPSILREILIKCKLYLSKTTGCIVVSFLLAAANTTFRSTAYAALIKFKMKLYAKSI